MPLRAPLSWLKDFIDINVTPEELARRLTLAGQEVEHIVTIGAEWENIYTGHVTKLEQHPNADRLNLATVEYGTADKITVVTGAPNIKEGRRSCWGCLVRTIIDQHQSPPKWSRLKPAKIAASRPRAWSCQRPSWACPRSTRASLSCHLIRP